MSERLVRPHTASAISARKRKKFMHDLQMLGVQVPGARKGQSSSMVHHVPLSSDLKRNDAKLIKILTHQDDESYGNVKSPANVSNLKDFVKVMADDAKKMHRQMEERSLQASDWGNLTDEKYRFLQEQSRLLGRIDSESQSSESLFDPGENDLTEASNSSMSRQDRIDTTVLEYVKRDQKLTKFRNMHSSMQDLFENPYSSKIPVELESLRTRLTRLESQIPCDEDAPLINFSLNDLLKQQQKEKEKKHMLSLSAVKSKDSNGEHNSAIHIKFKSTVEQLIEDYNLSKSGPKPRILTVLDKARDALQRINDERSEIGRKEGNRISISSVSSSASSSERSTATSSYSSSSSISYDLLRRPFSDYALSRGNSS